MSNTRLRRRTIVPVIDLFAGPGGLGEGFCAFAHDRIGFDVVLSVEKDSAAHNTLLLRSFYRALLVRGDVSKYYEYVKGTISRDLLFEAYPGIVSEAKARCLHLELGP